jgi:EAL domain-containing protein (putative c-di-GMP-specific phosphodiesterase class I)
MVFQPIHRLSDGRRTGFEALARFPSDLTPEDLDALHGPRWRDAGYTSEGPGVWFEMADALGLGVALEVAAIRAALARLPDLPAGEYMAVNVGPETLVSRRLAAAVDGRDLSRVVVELTEHLAIEDYDAVKAAVVDLQTEHSVRCCTKIPALAADDIGAGQAAFHHLAELGEYLSFAKMDVGLTRAIDTDRSRQALAEALVGMGRRLGFLIVAEGVEYEAQRVTLAGLDAHAAQGYLLGKPGPLP